MNITYYYGLYLYFVDQRWGLYYCLCCMYGSCLYCFISADNCISKCYGSAFRQFTIGRIEIEFACIFIAACCLGGSGFLQPCLTFRSFSMLLAQLLITLFIVIWYRFVGSWVIGVNVLLCMLFCICCSYLCSCIVTIVLPLCTFAISKFLSCIFCLIFLNTFHSYVTFFCYWYGS